MKLMKRKYKKLGLPPGTLVHIGDKKTEKVKITIIDYTEKEFWEKEEATIEEAFSFRDTSTVTWINIDGVHNTEIIEKIGKHFALHPLLLEDIAHTEQRPKMEDFGEYIFVVVKMLYYDENGAEIIAEQVSLILGKNFVISFQEREGDVFNPIRERIRNAKGRIRRMEADYLAYALIDAVVDHYFLILEKIGERIENLEDELVSRTTSETLRAIHILKREMIFLRRSVWPLREVISGLGRRESVLIKKSTELYLKDVYDHTIQVIDTVESFRDMVSGMLDTYLSSVSNRMNEVMKVLTIIATIFIPLTFIAGIYGMNFQFMPELGWRWGYFMILCVMALIVIGMVIYFKKKNWL